MPKTIEESAIDLDASATRATRASQQLHDIANLGPTAVIQTDSGPVPSIAKLVADKNAQIESGLSQYHESITDSIAASDDAAKGAGQVGYGRGNAYQADTVGRTLDVSLIALGLSGFVDRGAWQGATAYAVGDMYISDGQIHYVAVAHTSTTVSGDFADGKVFRKNADFVSYVDPINYAKPAQTWADMASGMIKRLNAAGTSWIVIGSLFRRAANIYPIDAIPATDIGPIFVEPFGLMSFDQAAGFYISSECGKSESFYMATPPPGRVKANGAVVSRTDPLYRGIFARIGTTFGAGDGSTTFQLPDMRGEFERGLDDGRGVDAGRTIGSAQSQTIQSHAHGVNDPTHAHSVYDPGHAHAVADPGHAHGVYDPGHTHGLNRETLSAPTGSAWRVNGSGSTVATGTSTTGIAIYGAATGIGIYAAGTSVAINGAATGISIQNTGSAETRPRNIAVLKCIHI
jgi:microcystin-dependent protein